MGFFKKVAKQVKRSVSDVKKDPLKAVFPLTGGSKALATGAAIGTGAYGISRMLNRPSVSPTDPAAFTSGDSSGRGGGSNIMSGLFSGLGTTLLGAGVDYLGNREARSADLASAREQMAFQKMMSDTSHQREVRDLEAAGLNPALSANAGAPSAVGQSIDAENMVSGLQPAMSSARDNARLKAELSLMDTQKGIAEREKGIKDVELFERTKDAEFLQNNPKWFEWKKKLELISPVASSARDAALAIGGLKFGFQKKAADNMRGSPGTSAKEAQRFLDESMRRWRLRHPE